MRQIASKLNIYGKGISIASDDFQKTLFNFILGSFAILAFFYILFLGNMVVNVVERRSLEAEAHELSLEVENLELAYFTLSKGVDLELSSAMGFKEIKADFATRKSLGYQSASSSNGLLESIKAIQNDL